MKIALSMLLNDTAGPSGTIRYFAELLHALLRIAPEHRYITLLHDKDRGLLSSLPRHRQLEHRFLPSDGRGWHRAFHVELPALLKRERVDLLHATTPHLPLQTPCRTIATLHDLIPVVAPRNTLSREQRAGAAVWVRLTAHLADHLIVPSFHTREDLVRHLGIPARKMSVIPYGCPRIFQPMSRERAGALVRRRFRLKAPFFLTVGSLVPRKNHRLLIRAFLSMEERGRRVARLAIVGRPRWLGKRPLSSMRRSRRIRYLGVVTDEALRQLYCAAEALVMPSEYEGFGFPLVEAMGCGTPVVASRRTSLPEVLGNAGLLVKEKSAAALSKALSSLLDNPDLGLQLRRASLERAREFDWDQTARRTLEIYKSIMPRRLSSPRNSSRSRVTRLGSAENSRQTESRIWPRSLRPSHLRQMARPTGFASK